MLLCVCVALAKMKQSELSGYRNVDTFGSHRPFITLSFDCLLWNIYRRLLNFFLLYINSNGTEEKETEFAAKQHRIYVNKIIAQILYR